VIKGKLKSQSMPEIDPVYEKKYEEIVKKKVLELFRGTGGKVFLFGSRARGDYKRGADFDIGVESVDYNTFRKLKIQFDDYWDESIVPYKADFVYFENAAPEFVKEAKKNIVIWKEG